MILEDLLQAKFRRLWNSHNTYAKHIGNTQDGAQVFCIFELHNVGRDIKRQEHALVENGIRVKSDSFNGNLV
jgi:hypothetical protein